MQPYIGHVFETLDEGISFYEAYANECRFDTRRFGHKYSNDIKTWQTIVCSRQGEKWDVNEEASSTKRRRRSSRCNCNAKLTLKYSTDPGSPCYVVSNFVDLHNHEMVDKKHARYMKSNRNLGDIHYKFMQDCSKANIGPTKTFNLLKEFLGGYDAVGCTVTDIRNCKRDILQEMKGADVQMILNQMEVKKNTCDGFHYKFQQGTDGKLNSLFWCDAVSRKNYKMFGDIVSFDTTYSTNKYCMVFGPFTGKDNHGCPVTFGAGFVSNEGADSFSWLLREFVDCMGFAPKLIITDQDWGMKLAIERVLTSTRHRWCMWHIMMKLPEKVPKRILANEELKKDLDSCIWSELLEPEEFEETWLTIVNQYGLQNEAWFTTMFAHREYWIPAYFRDFPMGSLLKTTSFSESENSFFKRYTNSHFNLADFVMHYNSALDAQRNITERLDFSDASKVPILSTELLFEKHAAAMYTDRIFQQVQDEIAEAHRRCRMSHFELEDNTEIYTIMDSRRNKGVVRHEVSTESYQCDCKLFLRRGILCSHIFWLFKNHDVKEIPSTYIGTRWLKTSLLKSVHNDPSEESSTSADSQIDAKRAVATKLHSLYFHLFQRAQSNADDMFALFDGMEELSHKLFGDTVPSVSSMGKAQSIENLYGLARPSVVTVHPPNVVSTKGSGSTSGKRIQSSLEKAIILQNKPKRRCAKCREMGHHDARNCGREKGKSTM
ncbi:protein FAR1-RELATED SEQUENCE 5-like [Salvia splendens]|uniref:protein FAR1-RELATED SEQUENCE 5-like n=1 Tax=Salvia splendens TaxID=180675 RepID=UPI001C26D311|nr:protein FAR1-RELATED SEQUENCE 5-like [Salvia splendens]